MKLVVVFVFAFCLGAVSACGQAGAQSGATIVPSPIPGYICFAVGSGGNCVRE